MRKALMLLLVAAAAFSAADLYAAAWVRVQDIGTPRYDHFLASDGADKIWVFGGANAGGILNSAEVYTISTDTWSPLAAMPGPLGVATAAYLDGKVYIPGGFDGSSVVTTMYIYDVGSNTYDSSGAPLPAPRYAFSTEALGGYIYVCGGGDNSVDEIPQADCWKYDPVGDSWTSIAPMLLGRKFHGSGIIAGEMYVFGGIDPSGNELNTMIKYTTGSDTWTTVTAMPVSWWGGAGFSYDGGLFAGLGVSAGELITASLTYDPAGPSWAAVPANNPVARFRVKGAEADGFPWLVGGAKINFFGNWVPQPMCEYFDVNATTTTTTTHPPTTTTTHPSTTTTTIPGDDDVDDDTDDDADDDAADDSADDDGGIDDDTAASDDAGGDDDDDSGGGCCG